ncbi:MAG TPA: type II secretion system protein GspG [bacterium]|nr:type II secretion system protein GspG [bacterium]HQO35774.1 type II secretion system protein GspG [bacterium]HQP98186.1 type II secretion system protein GspG [bacterium]
MQLLKHRNARIGFTLIELLIVVAIIGILAAIAVPNFMNARIRAMVAQAKSDIKALASSCEQYYLDHNTYPNESEHNIFQRTRSEAGLVWLTTPVGYMSGLPRDPFQNKFETDSNYFRCYETGAAGTGTADNRRWITYVIFTIGPDNVENGVDSSVFSGAWYSGNGNTYMPSNGLRSNGDIYWCLGNPSVMRNVMIDGKIYNGSFPPNFPG